MGRIHVKGDVLCTLILFLLLCVLWYAHRSLSSLGTLCIEHSGSRALLGAPTKKTVPLSQALNSPVCNCMYSREAQDESKSQNELKLSNTIIKSKVRKAASSVSADRPAPTPPQFDFKDYLRKKDQRDFRILIDQPKKCTGPKGNAPYLLIAVKSIAGDFEKRQVVRQTWGREVQARNKRNIRTVFLLGMPHNLTALPLWDRLLEYESNVYKDILLWDFEDTFFNLTLKETHFLRWVNTSCSEVSFIFKGDADVYVNVENILEMLDSTPANQDFFVGDIIVYAKPIRRRSSKYFVPESVYGQWIYPLYAGGGGFVMSGHTALKLHTACKEVELFPIDDVFLGMCLLRIGLKPSAHQGFRTFGIPRPSAAPHLQVFDPCFYKELMVVHSLTVPQMWLMWNLLHDPTVSCHNSRGPKVFPFKWRKNSFKTKVKDGDSGMQALLTR